MTAALVRTGVATCCGGHRPAAGGCCWKCPTCAPRVANSLDVLCRATSAAVAVVPLFDPPVQGVLT